MTTREIAEYLVAHPEEFRRLAEFYKALDRPYDRRSGKRWQALRKMKRAARRG